jgi:hypothetical protein
MRWLPSFLQLLVDCLAVDWVYCLQYENSFSRSDFVKGFSAMGGLNAVSELTGCATGSDVFAERGKWDRLVLVYNRIDAGATKPLPILHVSDTHFTEAYPDEDPRNMDLKEIRTKTFGGRQEVALRDSIAWANENVDFLKGILAGHAHITVQDRFSPTAMEYVVGGNFMFHGQEITFS